MVATVPTVLILLDFGEDKVGIAKVSENSKYASTTLSYIDYSMVILEIKHPFCQFFSQLAWSQIPWMEIMSYSLLSPIAQGLEQSKHKVNI